MLYACGCMPVSRQPLALCSAYPPRSSRWSSTLVKDCRCHHSWHQLAARPALHPAHSEPRGTLGTRSQAVREGDSTPLLHLRVLRKIRQEDRCSRAAAAQSRPEPEYEGLADPGEPPRPLLALTPSCSLVQSLLGPACIFLRKGFSDHWRPVRKLNPQRPGGAGNKLAGSDPSPGPRLGNSFQNPCTLSFSPK